MKKGKDRSKKKNKRITALVTVIMLMLGMIANTMISFSAFDVSGAEEIKEGGLGVGKWKSLREGQHSDWKSPGSGFIVPAEYANKLKKASGFTTSSFGKTVSWASIESLYPSQPRSDDGYYFFDTTQITEGNAGVWLRNIAVYDNAVGADVKLDCKITIMNWEDETTNTPDKHH